MAESRLRWKARKTPLRGSRRLRNWRRLEVGQRIADKHGELSDWRLLRPPFDVRGDFFARVECQCVGCDRVYTVRLNNIVGGYSTKCRKCADRLNGERQRKSK